jgi:hypothetical protein
MLRFLMVSIAGLLSIGCNDRDPYRLGKTAPVKGRVLLGDTPLHTGTVTFQPDAARGNTSPHQPTANIDANGHYELFTVGKTAAPLGWYLVVVTAYESDAEMAKRARSPGEAGHLAKSLIDLKYERVDTTTLAVEVVENPAPGSYDLKLSR